MKKRKEKNDLRMHEYEITIYNNKETGYKFESILSQYNEASHQDKIFEEYAKCIDKEILELLSNLYLGD